MNGSRLLVLMVAFCLSSLSYAANDETFSKSSCSSREPTSKLNLASDESPFELQLSKFTYKSSNENEPFTVSIVRKPSISDDNNISFNDNVKIQSFMLQAVQSDDHSKVVGSWKLDDGVSNFKTIDCSSSKDTLVEIGLLEDDYIEIEWQFTNQQPIKKDSGIVFIASIVGSNKSYWKNIVSDKVSIVYTNELELNLNDILPPKTEAAESVTPANDEEPNSESALVKKTKRDANQHFAMSTSQCGSKKSCYVSLKTCDVDPKTCNFVLSWDFDGELVNYELTGLSSVWISLVFSQDQELGNDNVVVCQKIPGTESVSISQYYKHTSDSELEKLSDSTDNLVKKQGYYNAAGYIFCKFSRPKVSSNPLVTDLSIPHYVFIERGTPGEIPGEKLGTRFQASDNKIDFASNVYVPTSSRSWLVKVHAILGIIAWILLGSIGILMARYYKPLWPNRAVNSLRVWFTFHRPLMIFVTLLSLLSLLFALIELEWTWSVDGHDLLHAILGIVVIICACINPILGFFRPKPDSPMRCCFFWFHWLIGTLAYCLAVPTIFIGMDLNKSDLPNWCAWLLFGWVIFHIIVEIVLEIHYCCTFYQLQGNYSEYNDVDKNKIPIKKKNPPGYRWKPTLLFFYAIVTAIVVSILVIAIVLLDI